LVRPKSGTTDIGDSYAKKMVDWRDSLIQQASTEWQAARSLQEIGLFIDYLSGKNWWGENRPQWRSSVVDNYLADQRREALASLTSTRPAFDVSSTVEAYKDQGKITNDYIKHTWVDDDLDLKLVEWIDHALFGTGFWKITCYEPGIFEITAHGLDEVIPVMMRNDLQTAAAVIYRTYQNLDYFIGKFGRDACEGLQRYAVQLSTSQKPTKYARPDSIPEYVWNPMSPAMKARMSRRNGPPPPNYSPVSPFISLELMEIYSDDWHYNDTDHAWLIKHPDLDVDEHNYHYIVPPKARLFPRKRLTVFAGDKVMYDGPAPFWHGLYPFVMLQLNPCVWSPGGISKYRDILPLNMLVNRIVAGFDENIMQALNQTTISKRGAIDPVSWERFIPGKPNQKLLMNPTGDPVRDLRRLDPPIIPAYVAESLRYAIDTIKKRSGSLDISGLARKKQVPGGDAIENMRDAMSSPFQLEGRYVEAALKRAGIQAVSHVFQFTTLERRLQVLGPDGQTEQDYQPPYGSMSMMSSPKEDHWKKFPFKIAPGSMHSASKFQRKSEAIVLRRQGDLSMQGLYELAEVPLSYEIEKTRLMQEHKEGIGPQPKKAAAGAPRTSRSQRTGSPI